MAAKGDSEAVAFMIRHTSGILCAPLLETSGWIALDPMVAKNDAPMSTAFTVSIDYKRPDDRNICGRASIQSRL